MISKQRMLILSAIGLAVVLSGCSFGSRASSPAARQEAANTAMQAELEHLRKENTELRREQAELTTDMSNLEQEVGKRAEEQQRFQEMMAGNFDLLEQSVSMSMAQADTRKTFGSAATRPVAMAASATAPRAQYSPSGSGTTKAIAVAPVYENRSASRVSGSGNDAVNRTAPPVALAAAVQYGTRSQESAFTADRDLEPPQQPIGQQAHPAAKPLYDKGFAAFARQDYGTSVLLFSNFLERYPADNYSDNAQFWIAESYYRQSRWEDAEDAYRKVLRNYEHRSTLEGFKTPDAIYRIGQTYLKRQKPDRAAYYFANVSDRFGDSSAGRKAQKEMSSIAANTAQANR